ncbi:Hsp90 co-chaperone Cdc37 [Exaiptasia diaphana]|nr:Hsp90 co-chaperone Cdc37 [Exaiptasia diaphana]
MVDYSRWDHIEVSDDEDDTHPNIDTPSLFRWRHQARVERMEESKKKRDALEAKMKQKRQELENLREKLKNTDINKDNVAMQLKKAEEEMKAFKKEDEQLSKNEKIINKPKPSDGNKELTPEEQEERSKEFMDKYENEIKHFGMLHDYGDSRDYLIKHPHLTCDDTANYLALWCINLQVQEVTTYYIKTFVVAF